MFQAPTVYNPFLYPENASIRRAEVLLLMHSHGYITKEEEEIVEETELELSKDGIGIDRLREHQIDFYSKTGKTTYGYNPGAGYLSGTDPIGEAMMWGLGGGAASAALRSLFPTYGATAGWLAFGDNNKDKTLGRKGIGK